MAENQNGGTAVLDPKVGSSTGAAPTKDQALAMVEAFKVGMAHRSEARKLATKLPTLMRAGSESYEAGAAAIKVEWDGVYRAVTTIMAFPNGVTPKGKATRADLLIELAGNESRKEVQGRIKDTLSKYAV